MSEELISLLRDLTDAPGTPGNEGEVRSIVEDRLRGYAELSRDRLGSVIARKPGSSPAPKVMLAGHLDEIGFMVTRITDEGFLKFQTLGGWWEQVMLAQRVVVKTRKGDVWGVVGSKPPHILTPEQRKKVVEKRDMFIDIGVASKEEAEAAGVRPGDPIIPVCEFRRLANPKYLMAKALDNRVGCAVAIEVLRRLKEIDHPNTVYGVATVQEEVGLRGAQTSAQTILPDVAFALDVGIAGDTPGVKADDAQSKLGKGPTILLYDATLVSHWKLRNLVLDVAERAGISVQFDSMPGGGTDAGRMHLVGSGVPSLAIAVPVRYIHSHAGIVHADDLENTVRLMVEVVRSLDAKAVADLVS